MGIARTARRERPDRHSASIARLEILRESDLATAVSFAAELVERERAHRVLEPALALLEHAAGPEARSALRLRFLDLAEVGDRYDQDCALRVAIVKVLRAIAHQGDQDLAEAGVVTVQLRLGIDVAQGLRAESLLLLAELNPTRADLRAIELLHDPHASTFSGEPAVTAVRVLARRGHILPIWGLARRPGTAPDLLAQAFASLSRFVPPDLQLEALRAHLKDATASGETGEPIALVAAEAILLNGLTEGYGDVLTLLRATPNLNLYGYLVAVAARGDSRPREMLMELQSVERDKQKSAALVEALGPH